MQVNSYCNAEMRSRHGYAGLPAAQAAGRPKKKGPLVKERPKSREETPKVGYDISGSHPDMPMNGHMGLFALQCNRLSYFATVPVAPGQRMPPDVNSVGIGSQAGYHGGVFGEMRISMGMVLGTDCCD
jgi:hypothetical protein